MQFIQMWIIPLERGLRPSVEQRQYDEGDRLNKLLQILKPVGSAEQGVDVHEEARMYVSRLEDGRSLEREFTPGHGGYLYLLQGRLDVNGDRLASGDAAYITSAGRLRLEASITSELIIVDTVTDPSRLP
jgi:redox-sensitive bicupin YhaK (pirin superfamily)